MFHVKKGTVCAQHSDDLIGVCTALAALGEACDFLGAGPLQTRHLDCADGLGCVGNTKEAVGKCAKMPAIGEPCSWRSRARCNEKEAFCLMNDHFNEAIYGVCAKRADVGQVCGKTEKGRITCARHLVCTSVQDKPGVCVNMFDAKAGESCSYQVACASGLYCDQMENADYGSCKAKVGDGQNCGGATDVLCTDGLKCLYQLRDNGKAPQGTCVSATRKTGESCGGYFEHVQCADAGDSCKMDKRGSVGVCTKRS